jgi:quercetin dioxygenase-like cupin family protein
MKRFAFAMTILSLLTAAVLWATPGSLFVTTPLARSRSVGRIHINTPAQGENDVLVQAVAAKRGAYSGWHSHPGQGIVVVYSGRIANYDGDDPTCTPKYYSAGDVFTEEPGHVHFIRSEGAAPYRAIATFELPVGVPSRTDVPSPGNCPF